MQATFGRGGKMQGTDEMPRSLLDPFWVEPLGTTEQERQKGHQLLGKVLLLRRAPHGHEFLGIRWVVPL
jgi:hypothetical protein